MYKLAIAISCLLAIAYADSVSDRNAETKSYRNLVNSDGSYEWQFETDNEIYGQEAGVGGVSAQGTAHWYSPEGTAINLVYKADHNGYQPQGEHLPTPPPTPPLILKALEYLRLHAPKRPDESL